MSIYEEWSSFRAAFGREHISSATDVDLQRGAGSTEDSIRRNDAGDFTVDGFVAGRHVEVRGTRAPVSAAIQENVSAATFIDYTTQANSAAADDVNILPTTGDGIGTGDAFYLGSRQQFVGVRFSISTNPDWSGNPATWQFWDGLNWTELATAYEVGIATVVDDDAGPAIFDITTSVNEQVSTAELLVPLPTTPAVGDTTEFGAAVKFGRMRFDIAVAAVGTFTLTWEYWNGSAWSALSVLSDSTNGLQTAGVQEVVWNVPTDWESTVGSGDSVERYFVRMRVSAFTSISTRPTAERAWAVEYPFDETGGLYLQSDPDLDVYWRPKPMALTTVNGQGPFYFVRAIVLGAGDPAPMQDVVGSRMWIHGANDGDREISSVNPTVLSIVNDDDLYDRFAETQTGLTGADVPAITARPLDADYQVTWPLELVRTGVGFGDNGTTLEGIGVSWSGLNSDGEAILTCNAFADDISPGSHSYDWYVHSRARPLVNASGSRRSTINVRQVTSGPDDASGSIAISVNKTVCEAEGIIDAGQNDIYTAAQLIAIFDGIHIYCRRRSDAAIQLLDLYRTVSTGEH